ncbi:hypothetical protein GQ600_2802 [Phytophthora cactorum]|nr:hypothetical protein GQ600_2802 [Phytophthora cactorum]
MLLDGGERSPSPSTRISDRLTINYVHGKFDTTRENQGRNSPSFYIHPCSAQHEGIGRHCLQDYNSLEGFPDDHVLHVGVEDNLPVQLLSRSTRWTWCLAKLDVIPQGRGKKSVPPHMLLDLEAESRTSPTSSQPNAGKVIEILTTHPRDKRASRTSGTGRCEDRHPGRTTNLSAPSQIWNLIRETFTVGAITRGLTRGSSTLPTLVTRAHNVFWMGHPALIRLLSYANVSLFIDGTFRCVPASFIQCVVLMGHDRAFRCYVPAVTMLATSKSEWSWWHCYTAYKSPLA